MGFAMPSNVTADAVGSYPTVSPLPKGLRPPAVYSLLHFPSPWALRLIAPGR